MSKVTLEKLKETAERFHKALPEHSIIDCEAI